MIRISKIAKNLKADMIGIIPTDTIYGIAASAFSKKAVSRAYNILERNPKKPFIILISSFEDLALFDIKIDGKIEGLLKTLWPGKISVVFSVPSPKWKYLHRGTKSLAFRIPKKTSLRNLLNETGPLISTSANPEGAKPAETIAEAKKYFGDRIDPVRKTGILRKNKTSTESIKSKLSDGVDFYIDGGKIKSLPSTLIEINKAEIRVLRKGAVNINTNKT